MILSKPSQSINPTYNAILERIHVIIVNLVRIYIIKDIYIYEDNLWLGILETADFKIRSTTNRLKLIV